MTLEHDAPHLPEAAYHTAQLLDIRLDETIASFCGRIDLYEHVLRGVARDSVNLPAAVRDQLGKGDRAEAQRTLHTFKGLVGTVGWVRVAHLAADAERRIGADDPLAPQALGDLNAALAVAQPQVFALLGVLRPIAKAQAAEALGPLEPSAQRLGAET